MGCFLPHLFLQQKKSDSKPAKFSAKPWLIMAWVGLLLMAHKGSYHKQEQAHHVPREGSCRIWNSLDPHAWVTRLRKSKHSKHHGKSEWWLQSPAFESWKKNRNKVANVSLISSLLCLNYDALFNYITTVCSFLTYPMPCSVQIINAIQLISSYSILLGK